MASQATLQCVSCCRGGSMRSSVRPRIPAGVTIAWIKSSPALRKSHWTKCTSSLSAVHVCDRHECTACASTRFLAESTRQVTLQDPEPHGMVFCLRSKCRIECIWSMWRAVVPLHVMLYDMSCLQTFGFCHCSSSALPDLYFASFGRLIRSQSPNWLVIT